MKIRSFHLAAASALSIAVVAPLLSGCEPANSQPHGGTPPPEVAIVTVQPQSVPATFEYVGQTAGSREVEVRARVTGIVLKRNYREGAPVAQGQSMFTIDPAPFEVAAARAEAALASAEAKLAQAKCNSARLKPLFEIKAASQKDYDDAASAEQVAEAAVKTARARLAREVDAGRLVLPRDGRIEVTVKLADGSVYKEAGKPNFTDVRVSGNTSTSEARAELPNPAGFLHPGQFVRVTLKGAERPAAILVPQRAVLEGPKGKFVYVVSAESKAEARPVELGAWQGDAWIVTAGLNAGDRVIVDGVMKIGAGAPVAVAESQPREANAAKSGMPKAEGPAPVVAQK